MPRSIPCPSGRPGFSLVELMTVVILVGILGTISFQSFNSATDRSNNAAVEASLHAVQQAVLAYQGDNERLPVRLNRTDWDDRGKANREAEDGTMLDDVQDRRYLQGNRLPVAPWSPEFQGNNLDATALDIDHNVGLNFFRVGQSAAVRVRVQAPCKPMGARDATARNVLKSRIGIPAGMAFTTRTWGAVVYETNGARNQFILHGIGKVRGSEKDGTTAGVVAIETNMN